MGITNDERYDNALDAICPTRGKLSRPKSGERWDDGPATLGNMIELVVDERLNDFPKWKERHKDDLKQLHRLMRRGAGDYKIELTPQLLKELASKLAVHELAPDLEDAEHMDFSEVVELAKAIDFTWVAEIVEKQRAETLNKLFLNSVERSTPEPSATAKRGGKSTKERDIKLWDEYSKGLDDGLWYSKTEFANVKEMKRSTASKALGRGEAAKRELNPKTKKRSRSR